MNQTSEFDPKRCKEFSERGRPVVLWKHVVIIDGRRVVEGAEGYLTPRVSLLLFVRVLGARHIFLFHHGSIVARHLGSIEMYVSADRYCRSRHIRGGGRGRRVSSIP